MQERYADLNAHVKPFLGIGAGTAASAYITYGAPQNNDTVIVNGTTFTKAAALGAAAFSTIAELCTLIDALSGITATQNGTIITLRASDTGEAGNSYTLALGVHVGTMAVSGATFTGGVNGDTTKDAVLNLLTDMACSRLDSLVGVSTLAKHTVTDELFDGGVSEVVTKDFPVLSVTSITQGSAATAWTQTGSYQFEKNRVKIDGVLAGGEDYERCKITYVAGYVTYQQNAGTSGNSGATYSGQTVTFPDDLLLATLLLIGGLFNQKQSMGVSQADIKGFRLSFRDSVEGEQFKSIIGNYGDQFLASV